MGKGQLLIYTTIYPIQFLTSEIGAEHVVVKNLIPPGSDAHSFEPDSQTMMDIARGNAFIYTGVGMENFAEKVQNSLENEKVKFYEAAKGIDIPVSNVGEHEEETEHHDHGNVDPHIWLDPLYTLDMAENIKEDLIALKPDAKDEFEKNFAGLKEELLSLHQHFEEVTSSAKSKEFVVSHAAYGYWEKRYRLKQIAISGLSPNQEPSQKDLKEIIEKAKSDNIHYIMFEKNVNTKVAKVVQEQIGADVLYLYNLESLTPEQMEDNETYLSLMKENIKSLQKALNPK